MSDRHAAFPLQMISSFILARAGFLPCRPYFAADYCRAESPGVMFLPLGFQAPGSTAARSTSKMLTNKVAPLARRSDKESASARATGSGTWATSGDDDAGEPHGTGHKQTKC